MLIIWGMKQQLRYMQKHNGTWDVQADINLCVKQIDVKMTYMSVYMNVYM